MRSADWQERFAAYIRARTEMPFAWGPNDCCSFAAGAVEAMTGRNPMEGIQAYDSPLAAARMVEEGGGLHALASSLLGDAVSPLMAAVGDVVLVENRGRELLAICNGTGVLAPAADRLAALDMTAARAAWKI